jgi:hypothetical protein
VSERVQSFSSATASGCAVLLEQEIGVSGEQEVVGDVERERVPEMPLGAARVFEPPRDFGQARQHPQPQPGRRGRVARKRGGQRVIRATRFPGRRVNVGTASGCAQLARAIR